MSVIDESSPLASNRDMENRRERLERQQASASHYYQYRALSFGSVLAIGIACLSIPTIFLATVNPLLLALPLIGILFGSYTTLSLRKRQEEYTGLGYARTGLAISTLAFVTGISYATYTYATEVPDGHQRISFSELQPIPGRKDIPHAPVAEELAGKKVFLKGYVYPDGQMDDIKRFVLVPDMGTCCFGGQPKLTDMIQVTLEDPLRTKYSYSRRSLAGTFHLTPAHADKVGTVIYHLEADHVK